MKQIIKLLEVINKKKKVKILIDETHLGIFENKTGKTNKKNLKQK